MEYPLTDLISKHYIVAEVFPHGGRFVHPNPRNLPEAIEKLRVLVEANRAIRRQVAATRIEIYELKGSYPVHLPDPLIDAENPGLPPTEDVLDPSKSVTFPNL